MTLQLYSGQQAAALLSISRMSVWRLIDTGALAAVNIGTEERPRYRIPETAIRAYVESLPAAQTKQASPEEGVA